MVWYSDHRRLNIGIVLFMSLMVYVCAHHTSSPDVTTSSKILWNSCMFEQNSSTAELGTRATSLSGCLETCLRWTNCTAVSYWRRLLYCRIITALDEIDLELNNGPCVYVRREDIRTSELTNECETCDEYAVCDETSHSCTPQGCPPLTVTDAAIYGNMHQVGSRLMLYCLYGSTSTMGGTSYPVCQLDGTWSDVITCSDICHGEKDILIDDRIQTRLMSYELYKRSNAKYCCKHVGGLVKLNSAVKFQAVQQYLLSYYGNDRPCLWVDGFWYVFFLFSDGSFMPTDSSMWTVDGESGYYVILDENYRFNSSPGWRKCGYLCESWVV